MCTHVCVCMYIYIYICVCIYIYIYIPSSMLRSLHAYVQMEFGYCVRSSLQSDALGPLRAAERCAFTKTTNSICIHSVIHL